MTTRSLAFACRAFVPALLVAATPMGCGDNSVAGAPDALPGRPDASPDGRVGPGTPDAAADAGPSFDLTVQLDGNAQGRVKSEDGRIDCPGTCTAAYRQGDVVTLTGTAAEGSRFRGWRGRQPAPYVISMDGAQTVSAEFVPIILDRALSVAGSGYRPVKAAAYDPRSRAIVFAGAMQGEATVCDQSLVAGHAVYVAKVDLASGACLWAKVFPAAAVSLAQALAVTLEGDVMVGGLFTERIQIGDRTLSAPLQGGFLARLAGADGAPAWVSRSDEDPLAPIFDLTVGPAGAVFTCHGNGPTVLRWSASGHEVWKSDGESVSCLRIAMAGERVVAVGSHNNAEAVIEIATLNAVNGHEDSHEILFSAGGHFDIGRLVTRGDDAFFVATETFSEQAHLARWTLGTAESEVVPFGALEADVAADILFAGDDLVGVRYGEHRVTVSRWNTGLESVAADATFETRFLSGLRLMPGPARRPLVAASTSESDGREDFNGIWLDVSGAAPVLGELSDLALTR